MAFGRDGDAGRERLRGPGEASAIKAGEQSLALTWPQPQAQALPCRCLPLATKGEVAVFAGPNVRGKPGPTDECLAGADNDRQARQRRPGIWLLGLGLGEVLGRAGYRAEGGVQP